MQTISWSKQEKCGYFTHYCSLKKDKNHERKLLVNVTSTID